MTLEKKNIKKAENYGNIPSFIKILREPCFPKPAAVDLLGIFNVLLLLK